MAFLMVVVGWDQTILSIDTFWQEFATDITLTVRDLTPANNPSTAYTQEMRNIDL